MSTITVTANPVLDKSTYAKLVVPEKKTRCESPTYAPGGGGINVSRAIKKLGEKSTAFFLAGGNNGTKIKNLLQEEGIDFRSTDSGANTRENVMVFDKKTESLYRFVMPGPEISEKYWKIFLQSIKDYTPKPNYLVASGSLPPGIPDDFYAQLASYAKKNDIKMVLDSSGPSMKLALEEGIYMLKPNLRELAGFLNKDSLTGMELEEAAVEILGKGHCSVLVISLGAKGALLARKNSDLEYIVPPSMPVISPVGAGDSMVAGIISGCTKGYWPEHAVRYGVAAGTAAAMTPGSELCRKKDVEKIFDWLCKHENNE